MMRLVYLLFSLFLPTTVLANVYQWVDANNITHFSDIPHPNSIEITLHAQSKPDQLEIVGPSSPASLAYKNLAITSPANESTIYFSGQPLEITVTMEPKLNNNDKLGVVTK